MNQINYLIVDDHSIFRQGLRIALSDEPGMHCIGEAGNGAELLDLMKTLQPEIILMDLKMPVMDGMQATQELRIHHPDVRILILTMHDDEQLVLHMLEAGANGYLIKNSDAEEIKLAMRACKENGFYFSDYVNSLMLRSIVQKNKPAARFKEKVVLTDREREVLAMICEGLTHQEIAQRVFVSPRTIENVKQDLMEKTGARNNAGLIVYGVKHGIVA